MSEWVAYFAYGSNMHPRRLIERTPAARFLGTARLPGWVLGFRLRGADGSGKAHIEPSGEGECHGVVYRVQRRDLSVLDRFEAGYERMLIALEHAGGSEAVTYLPRPALLSVQVRPYTWYRALVAQGACLNGLPAHYCRALAGAPAIVDPDPGRAARNMQTVAAIHPW